MKTLQATVSEVLDHSHEADGVVQDYQINPHSRLTLADAARAANLVPDELSAMLEVRMRRAARRPEVHIFGFQSEPEA
jgi:hypothetical protein